MMKLIISFLVLACANTPLQSAILIQASPKDYEKIDEILRLYTGPSPLFLTMKEKNDDSRLQEILLNPDIPYAEIKFIEMHLSSQDIKVNVAYVPSTIWNLFITSKCLNNLETYKKWESLSSEYRESKDYRERYFNLSDELMTRLQATPGEKDVVYFQDLSTIILKEIEQANLKEIKDDYMNANAIKIKNKLLRELNKIRSNEKSILHAMIEEEVKANSKNQILLVRGTEGIELKADREEIYKKDLNYYSDCINFGFECSEPNYPKQQWYMYAPTEQHIKILDFPYTTTEGKNAFLAIQALQSYMLRDTSLDEPSSKQLSFGDSLLSGLLFDSGAGRTACTFMYYTPELMLYALPLEKKWLFSKGRQLFYFKDGSLETDGIFGSGEKFHPRLRALTLGPYTNHALISINDLTVDEKIHFMPVIDDNELKKKISQFVLSAANILSQAHVISCPPPPKRGEFILTAQNEASRVLFEKLQKQ